MIFRKWYFLLLIGLGLACNSTPNAVQKDPPKKPTPITYKHRSITFIIGSDKSSNKYYTNAAQFFRQHDAGENNTIKIAPFSLKEILDYLNTIPNGERWDKVNVISHGNSWTGLAVKLYPNGPRTMLEPLLEAQRNGTIPQLKENIFDEQSHIILYACGLGLNKPLMTELKEVFSTDTQRPTITSTKLFNIFSVGKTTSKHSLAYFYNSFYRPTHYLGKHALAKQLKERYPNTNINWFDALNRKLPEYEGQAFSYKYHIPISWTEVYNELSKRPKLKTKDDILNWILEQPEFLALIREYDIPLNLFDWSVQYKNYTNAEGVTKPAMKIKGKTVVMSVLQQVVKEGSHKTYMPDISNEDFFMTL